MMSCTVHIMMESDSKLIYCMYVHAKLARIADNSNCMFTAELHSEQYHRHTHSNICLDEFRKKTYEVRTID